MAQFCTFYTGDTFFGINILQVKEINNNMELTRVPDSPEYIKGLLNLRGQVITIFDLAIRLGREPTIITPQTRNLLMKTDADTEAMRREEKLSETIGNDPVGFIVDRIGDVIEVNDESIAPAPANIGDIQKEVIAGVVELEDELLILLRVGELIEGDE